MAIAVAEEGGIGVIDRGFRANDIEPQIREVEIVKRRQHGVIADPYTITPEAPLADALERMRQTGVGTLVVVDGRRRVQGLLTTRDLRFVTPLPGWTPVAGPERFGAPAEHRQAVRDIAFDRRRATRIARPSEPSSRVAVPDHRLIRQVEPVKKIAFVVREAGQRGVIRDSFEQSSPACGDPQRFAMASEVHERIHESDAASTAFAHVSRALEPPLGAPIGVDRGARPAQAAQNVPPQAPELAAPVVVRLARGGGEAALDGLPRPFRIRPTEVFDPQDQALGGTHARGSIHSSGGRR